MTLFAATVPLPQRVASKSGDKSVDRQAADDVITTAAPSVKPYGRQRRIQGRGGGGGGVGGGVWGGGGGGVAPNQFMCPPRPLVMYPPLDRCGIYIYGYR